MEELVSADKCLGTGRINHAGVGNLIQGGDIEGCFSLWVGDMGDDPLHKTGTWVIQ